MVVCRTASGPPRQGVILLVVVLMLALFLVVGLSFVFYAESQATASRIYREAPTAGTAVADVPPEQLLAWALGQLIYDVPDDSGSVYSAMRGHSLARTMYCWHYVPMFQPGQNGVYSSAGPLQPDPNHTNNPWDNTYGTWANTTPFNGLGPLRTLPSPFQGVNEYDMVNYTY